METLDLRKSLRALYSPPKGKPVFVDVPGMRFLMIDGQGDPNTAQAYAEAVQALYALSYGLKFKAKKELGIDWPVMPLEGLWWALDMAEFIVGNKESWLWTMMIAQPDTVTPELLGDVRCLVARKRALASLGGVRLETFEEGHCAQVMHLGPYVDEGPVIAALHQFIRDNGRTLRGKHHEIYLGDPRCSKPEALKTIIRQPVAPA